MIKKLGVLILAFSVLLSSLTFNSVSQVVLAEENSFGGYYEVMERSGVLDFGEKVDNAVIGVISGTNAIGGNLAETVSVLVEGKKVTIKELPEIVSSSMVLGNYYTLTVKEKSKDFRFVTKAIRTKEDIGVLNLTSKEQAITGYYVLANNIVLEKGEENQHDINGDEKGHGITYETKGFKGTFDGQGYNVEFWANTAGFFGAFGAGGLIKNTGFVNVHVYRQGENPVLFHGATYLTGTSRALIENVYIRMADGNIPEGAISMSNSIPLKLHNVVLDFPGSNVDHNTTDLSIGALWGADYGWWVTKNNGTEMAEVKDPLSYKDVYIIGRMPAMHYKYIPSINTEKKKGFYYRDNGTLTRDWMEGFAENEGVEENIFDGEKVYKGVRKYNTLALLADDEENNYSTFNPQYWGIEQFGIPVWLNGAENSYDIFLETFGQKTSAAFYLERGGISTATIGFGLGGISVSDATLTFEFIKGQEFISIDSQTGLVSAVADGMAQFKVKCNYNGKDFEKKYTVYVTTKEGYTPDEPDKGGCGTFAIDGGSLGGGALMILSAVAVVTLKKKRKTV